MTAPSTFKFALACGTAGAWVDVTADVLFEEGNIPIREGRESSFDDIGPGTYSFTLTNPAGKYTPGNPATTLATPLTEGMGVNLELAGQLFAGTVRDLAVIFPPKELASTARVRITVDDMLGDAGRHELSSATLMGILADAAIPYLRWPFDEAAGAPFGLEQVTGAPPIGSAAFFAAGQYSFGAGVGQNSAVPSSMLIDATAGDVTLSTIGSPPPVTYGQTTLGSWGAWVTGLTPSSNVAIRPWLSARVSPLTTSAVLSFGLIGTAAFVASGAASVSTTVPTGRPCFISATSTTVYNTGTSQWDITWIGYVDGVAIGSVLYTPAGPASLTEAIRQLQRVDIFVQNGPVLVSQLVHSRDRVSGELAVDAPASTRLAALAAVVPEITFDTIPTLSSAILSNSGIQGSALDVMNDAVRAEQGYMWVETSGTLLAPTPKIKIGARNRERASDYTFDVSEILDPIPFIHSLMNTVSQFTATGPTTSATYRDTSLVSLVGSASSSHDVALRDYSDLYAYASDRVYRGANRGVVIRSITIDATSPKISRWADFTAIRQGYRLHITGLPVTQLGYSTWDGFVVGRQTDNTQSETDEPKTLITYYLAPWHPVSVFDTARLAAGSSLTLTSTITNSTTGLSITSSDGTLLSTSAGDYPLSFRIENEVVTAATQAVGATSPQTLTVTRGQIDPVTGLATTAAAHSAGVQFEVAEPAVIDY